MDLETDVTYFIAMFVFSVKLCLIFINGQTKMIILDNDSEGVLHKISLGFFVEVLLQHKHEITQFFISQFHI